MKLDKIVIVLGALLFISLSGNMFMAGLMLGQSVNIETAANDAAKPPPAHDADWKQKDEQIQKKLSAEDRSIVEEAKKNDRPKIDALRQTLKDTHEKLEAAQSAEPFDQSAVDAAVHAEADAKAEMLKALRQARQNVMEKLSPEGRETIKTLAPWKKLNGRNGKHRDFGGDGDRPVSDKPAPDKPETYGQSPPQPAPAPDAGNADTHSNDTAPVAPAEANPEPSQP